MKYLSLLLAIGFLAGCAKDKSYETILKENVYTKDFFKNAESDDYLYLVSVGETPKDITASRPFWQGQEKIVKFEFNENSMNVVEKSLDERYQENSRNNLPVLTFEIDHVDYKCAEDEYGDCTNKEEEDSDTPTMSRKYIKINRVNFENNNTLPIALNSLFSSCFSVLNTEIVKSDIQKDIMNFTVRKTYKAGMECADIEKYSDINKTTFTIDYHHSIAKLSSIASEDYEKVDYPYKDTNTFGYFTTNRDVLAVDNSTTDESEKVYLSRFNPKNKEIVYYLNAPFYEKGMEGILTSTHEGVKRINESFKAAGVDTKVVLKDGSNLPIGDLRYNFIILVKDPQASGVIGYGPSATNPRTGEIVNARTVMYYGTMKKYLKYTYDDVVKEFNQLKEDEENGSAESGSASTLSAKTEVEPTHDHKEHYKKMVSEISSNKKLYKHKIGLGFSRNTLNIEPSFKNLSKELFDVNRMVDFKTINKEEPLAQIEEMSRMNVYHGSMFNFHSAVKSSMSLKGVKRLKFWDELTVQEQEDLIQELMPSSWISTLVHEIGHNLGLRHNFNGSEDKDNYYTNEERTVMGIKKAVTYSSVMDYAYSELNSLPKMGKYDIAAIRFGYKREVEAKSGKFIKVTSIANLENDLTRMKSSLQAGVVYYTKKKSELETSIKSASSEEKEALKLELEQVDAKIAAIEKDLAPDNFELKDYQFCTDEHVSVNPGCNRFDEGSGMTGIVEHYINSYDEKYARRNFRGTREDFSGLGDGGYLRRIYGTFRTMRLVFEVFDRINTTYTLSADDWEKNEFLKDLKVATQKVNDFFLRVIKTPGVNCILLNEQMQIDTQLAITDKALAPEGDLANCFESETLANYAESKKLIIAQYGQNIDNARSKFLKDKFKPDPSAISVRGIYLDKLVAMNFLAARDMGQATFNTSMNSFLDYAEFAKPAIDTFAQIFMDKVEGKADVMVQTPSGMQLLKDQELSYKLSTSSKIKSSYSVLARSFIQDSVKIEELRNVPPEQDFKKMLMRTLKKELATTESSAQSQILKEVYSAKQLSINPQYEDRSFDEIKTIESRRFGLYKNNTLGMMLFASVETNELLNSFEREKLIDIYRKRAAEETMPEDTTEEDKKIWDMDLNILFRFLTNDLPTNEFVRDSLEALSV